MVDKENLGPAERIINAVIAQADHVVHNRPGTVRPDGRTAIGVRWNFCTTRKNDQGEIVVFDITTPPAPASSGRKKRKSRRVETMVGVLDPTTNRIGGNGVRYQPAGIFPEAAEWAYKQVAEVWKVDNEFAARWASYAYAQEHRDLKVVLAAFLLVQSRYGAPVVDGGKTLFFDADFRNVGEAMALLQRRDKHAMNASMLLRIGRLLTMPGVVAINRELGFGRSMRHPPLGRWTGVVQKWLQQRERNPAMLDGLVRAGLKRTVAALARHSRYRPETARFFEAVRWKQKQAADGRRTMRIGEAVETETWAGLTEAQVCERIEQQRPSWKVIVSMVPPEVGITRAVVACAIESGCLGDKDMIMIAPTLEALGLFAVQTVKERFDRALATADDMRAANIAKNVKSQEVREQLQGGAALAAEKQVEEVARNIRFYVMLDRSDSMEVALDPAKRMVAKLLQAVPRDRVHLAAFNTTGHRIKLPPVDPVKEPDPVRRAAIASRMAENALSGVKPCGGTDYGAGVDVMRPCAPVTDDEDCLFIFIGDEQAPANRLLHAIQQLGPKFQPMAFGLVHVFSPRFGDTGSCVQQVAQYLGIPCFPISEGTFDDVYELPRVIRNLVAATPVGPRAIGRAAPRKTLADVILATPLLVKPSWA